MGAWFFLSNLFSTTINGSGATVTYLKARLKSYDADLSLPVLRDNQREKCASRPGAVTSLSQPINISYTNFVYK